MRPLRGGRSAGASSANGSSTNRRSAIRGCGISRPAAWITLSAEQQDIQIDHARAPWRPCADGPFPVPPPAAAPTAGEGTTWSPPPPPDSGTTADRQPRAARFHRSTTRASDEYAAMQFARVPAAGWQRGRPGLNRARCRRFSRRHLRTARPASRSACVRYRNIQNRAPFPRGRAECGPEIPSASDKVRRLPRSSPVPRQSTPRWCSSPPARPRIFRESSA